MRTSHLEAPYLLVNFASVSLVDEVALAGGDVPLADGGVGRAGVHVNIVQCCARYVLRVAPGSRGSTNEYINRYNCNSVHFLWFNAKLLCGPRPVTAEAAASCHFRKVFGV